MAPKKPVRAATNGPDIIVVGTSAGGLEALDEVIGELPADFSVSIFIVQHMAPENTVSLQKERRKNPD